ncbi:MAG: hypothetical protein F4Y86_01610 [Gammaproteobacteria bacterium]|nr:hypothetical protein [Gammaproteobacteria bacterium]
MINRIDASNPIARVLLLGACQVPCAAGPIELVELLAGEYDNNEQVWQQGVDDEPPDPRRHWRFERRGPASMALAVGHGQAASDAPELTLSFAEGVDGLVTEVSGMACRVRWRERDGGAYEGRTESCPGLPATLHVDREWLTATWPAESGERVERARRVRHYTGWVALRRDRLDPAAAQDDYVFLREARWHDEGFLLPVLDGGDATGYAIELARLTYQNTRTAVLKLGVVDTATGETLAYSWAEPGAGRIGINLRWIQAGLTREGSAERSGAAEAAARLD